MVEPGHIGCCLHVHVKFYHIQNHLQHRIDNAGATRATGCHKGLAVFENKGGGHAGKGALTRRDRIGFPA